MRAVLVVIMFSGALLQGEEPKRLTQCGDYGQGLVTYSYYEAVVRAIKPPGWQGSRITISFGLEYKYVLRTDGKNFELLRGRPNGDIYKQLQRLDKLCQLTPDPSQSVDLVGFAWQRKRIDAARFDRLHGDFTSALAQYVSGIQTRFPVVLVEGGVLHLHTPEYWVVYDNGGFEHVEVEAWDDTEDFAKMGAIIKWVREILDLSKDGFVSI